MLDEGSAGLRFSNREETNDVSMTIEDVLKALEVDGKFFLQFFLPEELSLEVPEFHMTAWHKLTMRDISKVALALPRGHAKSTLTKLACLWHLLFTPIRFVLYASNTSEIAAAAVVDIMNYIRSDNFRNVFGVPIFETEQDNRGFYKFTITVPDGEGGWYEKKCIMKSIGTGKQVRGMLIDNQRPQLLCADDVEDEDNTENDVQQKKVIKWIMGPLYKCMDKKWAKFIFIGNVLSNKCFLHQIVDMDDWDSMRIGCIKGDGSPLWPELWSLAAIREDFLLYQKLGLTALWFAEMMNMPMADADGLIKSEDIKYRAMINPGEQQAAFITMDPAISEKTHSDNTAIVVHVLFNDRWQVAEYIDTKLTPDQAFWLIYELGIKWHTKVVGIEMAGFQRVLKILFDVLMIVHNAKFDVYEVPHRNRPKTERLIAFCSIIRQGQWFLTEGDFGMTEQLLAYDPTKKNNKDDLIDAASMGPTMWTMYLPVILEAYEAIPANDMVRSGYNVARN